MSVIIPAELFNGRHTIETASTGEQVLIVATAGKPVFGDASSGYDIDPAFSLWNVTWSLKGTVDLSSLNITSIFYVSIPNFGTFALANVNGNLQTGVDVPFDISTVSGNGKFYLKSGSLYVDLKATVVGISHGPATIKLIPLPL